MEDVLVHTMLGIFTGIITSVALLVLKDIWTKWLRPYIEELQYKGVIVQGTWRGHHHDELTSSDVALIMTQSAHRLAGTFNFAFRGPGKQFVLEYEVTGYLWEGYLTLNFRPKDKALTTSAMALLKIAGGGHGLAGQFCFRNVDLEAVTAVFITLGKQTGPMLSDVQTPAPKPADQPAAAPAEPPAATPPAGQG